MNDTNLTDLNRRLYPVRKQLGEAVKASKISLDVYHRTLVQLAYEYAVAGYADETLFMVMDITPSYFKGAATRHMAEDAKFHKQATTVAEVLTSTGLFPTQKAARA